MQRLIRGCQERGPVWIMVSRVDFSHVQWKSFAAILISISLQKEKSPRNSQVAKTSQNLIVPFHNPMSNKLLAEKKIHLKHVPKQS